MLSLLRKYAFPLLGFLVLLLAGTSIYFYQRYNTLQKDPQKQAQDEARALANQVGKLVVLPQGEIPTIATVSDPETLKNQPFFADAKKGDKVLIYTTARKAVLYDPVANKIVNVAPLNIGSNGNSPTTQSGS